MRTLSSSGLFTLALVLGAVPAGSARAQNVPAQAPTPAPVPADETANEIIVLADALRGQVDAPEPPLLELGEADIAAYGAGSLTELLDALSSQTGSGSGRGGGQPAILLNGARIANFREIASFPPEAIEKVEVLPEEVALRYGFSADQRVVNFITKRSYSSRELELVYNQPWLGGTHTTRAEATYLQIAGASRMNFNVEWNDSTLLTEAERDIIQTTVPLAGDPDQALYRSLVADSAGLEVTGNFSTRLGAATLSLNPAFQRSDSMRLQGLDTISLTGPGVTPTTQLRTINADDPLKVVTRSNTYSLGGSLNSSLGDWQVVGTFDANHTDSRSRVDQRLGAPGTASLAALQALQASARAGTLALNAPLSDIDEAGFDEAITRSDTATSKVTANGRPVLLPAGFVSMTIDAGYDWTQIRSRDTRNAGIETSLVRGDVNAGVNLGVPLTSTREDFLSAIGDLTLNLSAGIDHLSDFGTLTDWQVGLNWQPVETLSLAVSRIGREAAPSLAQLGNPEIATFNVPVFDLTRGETVLATVVSGGNPNLPAQSQNDWRLRAQWQLPEFTSIIERANISVEYFNNRSENIATGFPVLSPTTEAAFPGRVTRDVTGRLVSIDQRPVTLASQKVQRLQFGINFNGPFGRALPPEQRPQNNNPMAQAFRAMNGGGQGAPGAGPGGPGQVGPGQVGPGQGGPGRGPGLAGGAFNPERFQQLRTRFCAADAANTLPTAEDLAGLPEQMIGQLRNPDGTINAERWAEVRTRFCSAQSGQGGGGFNAQAFQRLRQQFCGEANANAIPTREQLEGLPEQLITRITKADGTIDPELWKVFRDRICSTNPAGGAGGQGGGQRGGQGGQGPGGPGGQGGPGGGNLVIQTAPGGPGGGGFQGGPGGGGFQGGPGGGGGGGGGGFRGGGPGGQSADGRGRWFFNLNYQRDLSNEVLVSPGGPVLDLLDGDALSGGGQPRNSFNANGGIFYRGFGVNYNVRYTGESTIDGSGLPGSTDLLFDDFLTVNLRLFADLNQRTSLIEAVPLLRNTRVSLGVDNVFDARQTITDNNGTVPLRYQPFLVDPIGRRVQVELRKLF